MDKTKDDQWILEADPDLQRMEADIQALNETIREYNRILPIDPEQAARMEAPSESMASFFDAYKQIKSGESQAEPKSLEDRLRELEDMIRDAKKEEKEVRPLHFADSKIEEQILQAAFVLNFSGGVSLFQAGAAARVHSRLIIYLIKVQ